MALSRSARHLGHELRQGIATCGASPSPTLIAQRPLPVAGRHRQLRFHTLCQSGQQQQQLQQQQPVSPVTQQAVDVEAVQGATEWVPASQLCSQTAGPSVPSVLAGFSGAAWLTIAAIGPGPLSTAQQQPAYIAQALGVLALIIAVHEAGHFAAARLQGIHVTKFAIGFGPALVKFVRGEVEYSLRAIPLGGYVAFPDENDPKNPYKADDPDLLQNRSILSRAAVISAGVIANVIFAYLTLLVQISLIGKAEASFLPGVKIPSLAPTSLAAQSGLRGGDVIMRVGDTNISADINEVNHVVDLIRASPARPIAFTVQRAAPSLVGSDEVSSKVVTRWDDL
ncbi:peptidase family M50-domain-containing protein [Dunaliella salina]|uniref:Peptidase family M50-domain-containing protein n=1 Tax=Dunaliella salina TaxID=3046 RepID=A0ABQ7FXC2_DUNSA|nr:peptidase family M50-domain-containing protein [Dunaliella salina]|eukprot:KAF5827011.1 peptidase family M50-domain-containing protein [Dunaliella salina]